MATYTQLQYNTLLAAIATGATKVKYSDKEVEYRSLAEMRAILAEMALDLGITGTTNPPRTVATYYSGLGQYNDCE